ncbi:hypothetical protein Agub_g5277 [Astrephomene gubernaculifera]|uniref:Structure-specific endonuclease subunit SLX1 C-terminal domain-containing protein n=1 Tax=Astrephomene gubernaculifera TaxID=47775 RepID=A0AAD3DLL6_9CHLO|nr:hypothetical protein Agub_g5277 [Astrephomene gubernaculifera]
MAALGDDASAVRLSNQDPGAAVRMGLAAPAEERHRAPHCPSTGVQEAHRSARKDPADAQHAARVPLAPLPAHPAIPAAGIRGHENVASAPAHVRVFTAPMEDLPRALNDMDEDCSEGDGGGEEGNEEQRIGGTQQAGRGGGGGSKGQHRQGAAGEDGAEDGGGGDSDGSGGGGTSSAGGEGSDDEPVEIDGCQEKRLPAAKAAAQAACGSHQPAAAGTAAAAAARQRCHICQVAIQRHILVCSTCGVYFHLDCLAAKWCSAEAASGGGQERQRFGGVPEQGHCPACGTLHGWMTMLQGMQTVGWGNKPRGRRG